MDEIQIFQSSGTKTELHAKFKDKNNRLTKIIAGNFKIIIFNYPKLKFKFFEKKLSFTNSPKILLFSYYLPLLFILLLLLLPFIMMYTNQHSRPSHKLSLKDLKSG